MLKFGGISGIYSLNWTLRLLSLHISNSVDLFLSLDMIPAITVNLRVHFFQAETWSSASTNKFCGYGYMHKRQLLAHWCLKVPDGKSADSLKYIMDRIWFFGISLSFCSMAFKMIGEACRCFIISGLSLGYPRLILNLCEAGLCIPLDTDSLFFWLIHSC